MSPRPRPRWTKRPLAWLGDKLERGWGRLREWLKRNGEAFYILLRILLLLWQFFRILRGAGGTFPRARARYLRVKR
jgi:hypothetical protein